jgi:hypothetical protein
VRASRLHQIELYLSIVQRKALTPNDFPNLQALTDRLTTFAEHYRTIARPFDSTFTRNDPTRSSRRSPIASPTSDTRLTITSGQLY